MIGCALLLGTRAQFLCSESFDTTGTMIVFYLVFPLIWFEWFEIPKLSDLPIDLKLYRAVHLPTDFALIDRKACSCFRKLYQDAFRNAKFFFRLLSSLSSCLIWPMVI